MSAYTDQNSILGEIQQMDLIALTDDSPKTGNINTTVLNQIIQNASGVIDQYVGNVYDVPFNPVPPSVASMALTIACFRLYRRRNTPDEKNKFYPAYKDVIDFLKRVQKRQDVLDLSVQNDFSQVQADTRIGIFGPGNALSNSM